MKNNKNKGFTLIEILAVIIILALLLTIVVPSIFNILSNSKKGALKANATNLISLSQTNCNTENINTIVEEKKTIFLNGSILGDDINFLGKVPKEGELITTNNCDVQIVLYDGNWCAYKTFDSSEVIVEEKSLRDCFGIRRGPIYSYAEITNMINDGWIPISSKQDLSQIEVATENIFGLGTVWEDTYMGGLDKKYIQVENIDLGEFEPIGDATNNSIYNAFVGQFDGGGYLVENGIYDYSETSGKTSGGNRDYIGFFGRLNNATIKNINLHNFELEAENDAAILTGASINNSVVQNFSLSGNAKALWGASGLASGVYSNSIIIDGDINVNTETTDAGGAGLGSSSFDSYHENVHVKGNIVNTNALETYQLAGLYSIWGGASEINNCSFEGTITSNTSWTGGLVGYSYGTDALNKAIINNSHVRANISGGFRTAGLIGWATWHTEINDSSFEGNITSINTAVGGIGGTVREWTTITNSHAKGNINADFGGVGGVAGSLTSSSVLNNTSFEGQITSADTEVGGLVGSIGTNAIITSSEADVIINVNRTAGVDGYVGGAVGRIYGHGTEEINNVSITGEINSINNRVGGLVGSIAGTGVINSSTFNGEIDSEQRYNGGLVGEMLGSSSLNNSSSSFEIEVNRGSGVDGSTGGIVGYMLGNSTVNNASAVGTINTINRYIGGGVGWMLDSARVENSTANVNITSTVTHAGGFTGYATLTSSMNNCHSTGNVAATSYTAGFVGSLDAATISNSSATGTVNGANYIGGFVGLSSGTISSSFAKGNVTGSQYVGGFIGYKNSNSVIQDSYATGNASGTTDVGGFVGRNYRGKVLRNYSHGSASGTSLTGGFMGSHSNLDFYEVTACYWNTTTSGTLISIAGIGKTNTEMIQGTPSVDIYTGWDPSIWNFGTTSQHPRIIWE